MAITSTDSTQDFSIRSLLQGAYRCKNRVPPGVTAMDVLEALDDYNHEEEVKRAQHEFQRRGREAREVNPGEGKVKDGQTYTWASKKRHKAYYEAHREEIIAKVQARRRANERKAMEQTGRAQDYCPGKQATGLP